MPSNFRKVTVNIDFEDDDPDSAPVQLLVRECIVAALEEELGYKVDEEGVLFFPPPAKEEAE